jgi:splicing factor U2AF 65 kDa subunit
VKNPVSRTKMSKKIHSEKDSERVIRDGTAARTRPLSIQEIMLQREKKAASEDKKTKEGPQENDKGLSECKEQGRRSKSRKEPKNIPVEGSKKEKNRETTREGSKKENPRHEPRENLKKDDVRYTPKEVSRKDNFKDHPKYGSKINDMKGMPNVEKEYLEDTPKFSRKVRSYIRDDDHIVVRDKGISTSHKLRTRDDESRDANLGDMRERNGDTTKSQKGPGKSWNDETVPSSRINDKSEKRNETKRKGHSFDDEKKSEVGRPVLKRHDFARSRDSKHPDKNDGRKDYAKLYHGEPKLKRRRSRSRDLDQERYGRSISPPPREQRRSHRDDFGNYPPYYSVGKARRKHNETDKQRTSGNGAYTGRSYRRHESQLGGYSPRRKKASPQAEAATTKTSSPVTQSPKKKPATWDQRPAKTDQSNFLATLHPAIGQMAPILANVSALKKDPTTKAETILAGSNLSADSVQLTQATRPLRRLHIENLPDSTTEDILIDCLNDILLSSHPKHAHRSKPCLSCTVSELLWYLVFLLCKKKGANLCLIISLIIFCPRTDKQRETSGIC